MVGRWVGKKTKRWFVDRQGLKLDYLEKGIVQCEMCDSDFGLSFHHLTKRGRKTTEANFKNTRLLCAKCHEKADNQPGFEEFNERLKKLR